MLVNEIDQARCTLEISPDDHWLFEFIQPISILQYYQDKSFRDDIHKVDAALIRKKLLDAVIYG